MKNLHNLFDFTRRAKNRTRRAFMFALLASSLAAVPVASAASDPQEVAKLLIGRSNTIIGELLDLRKKNALTDANGLVIIRKHISPLFDFETLTKRTMGKHWRKASVTERALVNKQFRQLLEKTYAKVIAKYSGQQVVLDKAESKGKDRISVSLAVTDGTQAAIIEYLFSDDDGEPRIVDVKVEGVSLVANYRRQFASIIKQGGFEALAAQLDKLANR